MPVAGIVRLRKHLFGRQAAHGTKVAATRVYPFKGVPEVELNWTDPEVDLGSLDPVAAPHREAPALTAPLDIPQLDYNSLPILLSAFFGGGVEPLGAGIHAAEDLWRRVVDEQDAADACRHAGAAVLVCARRP